jgi:hypothetical protein
MREARIVLPHSSDPAHPHHMTAYWLEQQLCGLAGGCTRYEGRGLWVNPEGETLNEPISIFDVAVEPYQERSLLTIAQEMGLRAGQECVYVRLTTGRIEMVKIQENANVAEKPQLAAVA